MNSKITLLLALLCFLFINQTLGGIHKSQKKHLSKDNSDGNTIKKHASGKILIAKRHAKKVAALRSPKHAIGKILIAKVHTKKVAARRSPKHASGKILIAKKHAKKVAHIRSKILKK